jgi:hypothetical protein
LEAREHAEALVKYFEHIAHEHDAEVWRKGLTTAQEWLRLIDAESASRDELSAFIGIVHANRYRISGWFDLALGAYHWVSTKGIPLPPRGTFFASEKLPSYSREQVTPLEHANILVRHFEQYNREDPTSEAWSSGLETAWEWLRLVETQDLKDPNVSALVRMIENGVRKYLSLGWFDMALGVYSWCKELGFIDLIPDSFRSLLKIR